MTKHNIPRDYVTVLEIKDPVRGNKLITRQSDGSLVKDGNVSINAAIARTAHVPDAETLGKVLKYIGGSPKLLLLLGYVPGTENGKPYRMAAEYLLKEWSGKEDVTGWQDIEGTPTIARLKRNMLASSWFLLDRDIVRDMPEKLSGLNKKAWYSEMERLLPGLSSCSRVEVPSTTGRVLDNGTPMDASGLHVYVQGNNPDDLDRLGAVMLQRSFLLESGFMRPRYSRKEPGQIVGNAPWSIYDPTTFSRERLVFDGKPTVEGDGLTVSSPVVDVFPGSCLDLALVKDLTPEETQQAQAATGTELSFQKRTVDQLGTDGQVHQHTITVAMTTDHVQLTPETEIEVKLNGHGSSTITAAEYLNSNHEKIRCQIPFRDSDSWNGYLNRHADGSVFLFDNGTRVKYVLSKDGQMMFGDPPGMPDALKDAPAGAVVVKLGKFNAGHTDEMPHVLDSIDKHLASIDEPLIYTRSQSLVRIIECKPETVHGVTFKEKHQRIIPFTVGVQVQDFLTRHFSWFRNKQVDGEWIEVSVAAPPVYAQAYLKRHNWKVPPLTALIESPTIRPDGTLLQTSGYDRATGIYAHIPDGMPLIKDAPTMQDARTAYELLKQPFAEFPYISEECRAVALACVLTQLVRPVLRSAPLFAFSAAKMSEGKTLQADTSTMIGTGRSPAMMSWTDDTDEMRKRITAMLLLGAPVGCIDNINGTIQSDTLCTILTEPTFQDRKLGANEMVTLSTVCTWMLNGNHVRVAGDLTTRTLLAEIDSGVEFPEERTGFTLDLRQWVPENRNALVHAALTIIRAYWAAECPDVGVKPWGRFEAWSQMVRQPLVWVGMADPVQTVKLVQGDDPKREELRELLTAWDAVFGSVSVTAKEAIQRCGKVALPGTPERDLLEILQDRFAPDGQHIKVKRLSGYLGQNQNRVESDMCFKKHSAHASTMEWRVKWSKNMDFLN